MPRFRKLLPSQISDKTPGDPVTIVDQESEAYLTEELAALLPGSRVIGEEAVAADPGLLDSLCSGTVWIIDPLDGTKNFSEGKTPFAIMVGLVVDGEREAGWIYDPVQDRMCHAARGKGAFVDGEQVHARGTGRSLPVAAIATYFLPEARAEEIHRLAEGKIEVAGIPRCAGEQYPRLVLGVNDIALFERSHPWDHVPGSLFLEEAGGRIGRPDGAPYRLDTPGKGLIGAASSQLWDLAAETLFV